MSKDQIEYCGECPNYQVCNERAIQGRLIKCIVNDNDND